MPEVLGPYVRSLTAYDTDFGSPGVHRGLPSTTVVFVLPVDEPLDVGWADGTGRRATWSSLSGLHPAPAAIHHSGHQRGVQLALTLAGVRALFGMPASAWRGELLSLDDLGADAAGLRDLPERLAGTAPQAWATTVSTTLVAALAHHGAPRPRAEVGRALALLTGGGGVHEVADEVGFSRRRLRDLVREETGVTPKEYQRMARFEAASRLVGRLPLAEVAERCGYADQAHFTREFGEFAGCSPTTWLREEFPFVQDLRTGGDED